MLTLDEAINHCLEKSNCSQCGQEHRQLAEWLMEYKDLKDKNTPKKLIIRECEVSGKYYLCPACGRGVGPDDPYCRICGQSLE